MAVQSNNRDSQSLSPNGCYFFVGFGVAGALTGGLGYVTEDTRVVAVCLLTVIMFCHSSTLSSNAQLPLDIAPQ